MIKRTLYFGNPAYLGKTNKQLVIRLPEIENNDNLPDTYKTESRKSIPIEDIGVVILDHQQITITQSLVAALLDNNVSVISCNESHMPSGLMLPLDVNHTQHERFTYQINASQPLKKQLWQQTVTSKIKNQAANLDLIGVNTQNMKYWAYSVKSGDPDNYEARAAAYYWKNIFPDIPDFLRHRNGEPPNNILNYGYAILRAVVARGLLSSGLLPTLGIHHRNKYNAYCLADDIMEPYRPYVDRVVINIINQGKNYEELTTELKKDLLLIPTLDVEIEGNKSPLMVGLQRTTASLYRCYEGSARKILYPALK